MANFEKENKTLDEYINKLQKELTIEQEEMKVMFSSYDYVNWLLEFTTKYNDLSDDSWLYNQDDISKEDRDNVFKLSKLFRGIERYAKKNYIYPVFEDGANCYRIKVNGIGFEIGIIYAQDISFYCSRKVIENEKDYIDFNDIISGKRQENVDNIEYFLNYLNDMIVRAYQNGIPLEAISESVNANIKNIRYKRQINNNSKKTSK